MKPLFKKYCLLIFLLNLQFNLFAQQHHFIYLQTENKQPFYVKLDKKLLSSSASGYLIIPKLTDGTYTFTLGFPKNEWPEQNITYSVDKKDAGFLLKNFGDKGWGLFNWQTMNVVMAAEKTAGPVITAEIKNEIAPVKTESVNAVVQEVKKEEPLKQAASVTRIVNSKSTEGIELVFVDVINGKADTIRVFIPAEKKGADEPQTAMVSQAPPVTANVKEEKAIVLEKKPVAADPAVKEEVKKDTIVKAAPPAIETPAKEKEQPVVTEKPAVPSKTALQNSDCKAFASDEDFLKLRKKMAAEDNDDDMVAVARKVFKTKCFTVEQVKNLSVLFLKDDGRYKFFDAAYPFVSDSYNFSSLAPLLSDDYFVTRFKAMLRH